MQLKAPNGKVIIGTAEMTPGTAELSSLERDENGYITYDHAGDTEMSWDAQETITRDGEVVFVDSDYNEWIASELIPVDAVADPNATPRPPRRVTRELGPRQLSNILAALRAFQDLVLSNGDIDNDWIKDIATDGGKYEAMDLEDIDQLCEHLNCGMVTDHLDAGTYEDSKS